MFRVNESLAIFSYQVEVWKFVDISKVVLKCQNPFPGLTVDAVALTVDGEFSTVDVFKCFCK